MVTHTPMEPGSGGTPLAGTESFADGATTIVGAWVNRGDFGDVAPPMPSQRPDLTSFDGLSLFHLLELLTFRQYAGRLVLESRDFRVTLVLTGETMHSFQVEGADLEAETLRVLRLNKDITEDAAHTAAERAATEGIRPTYALFERHVVTAGQVVNAFRRAQRNVIRRMMATGQGTFAFETGGIVEGASDPVQTDARAVVTGILRDLVTPLNYPHIAPMLQPLTGRFPKVDLERAKAIPGLRLSARERQTIDETLKGTHVLQQVFDLSLLDRHETARLLFLLHAFGLVEAHAHTLEKKKVETPKEILTRLLLEKADADHFAVLGLHWTCHPDDLLRSRATVEKRFGPNAPIRTLADCKPLAEKLYGKMSGALETLLDPGLRRAYRLALQGEEKVKQAARFLAQQADEAAIVDRRKAHRLIECALDLADDEDIVALKEKAGL